MQKTYIFGEIKRMSGILLTETKMYSFGYCIWFIDVLDTNNWQSVTKDFIPHVTLKSHLSETDAITEYNRLKSLVYPVTFELRDPVTTCEHAFFSLQYPIKTMESSISWLPDDAHISFAYRYDVPFRDNDVQEMEKKVTTKKTTFDTIVLMNCNGHYSTWSQKKMTHLSHLSIL